MTITTITNQYYQFTQEDHKEDEVWSWQYLPARAADDNGAIIVTERASTNDHVEEQAGPTPFCPRMG
jgi:hypothetical protein